jgi:hypothetical protein
MMTPEQAWELMRRGVKRRLNANLTEQMQQFEADDEPAFGKPGWAMRLVDERVKRAKNAAQRCYVACRTEWSEQGRTECVAFFEAIYNYGLIPLFTEHNLDAERQFTRLRVRVDKGNHVSHRTALARAREIDAANQRRRAGMAILRRGWRDQIENDKRDCNLRQRLRRVAVKEGKIRKPGPTVTEHTREFREIAGKLWIDMLEDSRFRQDSLQPKKRSGNRSFRPHVNMEQLKAIAKRLDVEGFEPEQYLEGKAPRDALSALNKDKKRTDDDYTNWSKIATGRDRKLIKAMRRTLSRCAEFVRGQSRK